MRRYRGVTPLNGPQISDHGLGVRAGEAERRHVGVAGCKTLAQAFGERIEIEAPIQRPKRRRAGDRVAT